MIMKVNSILKKTQNMTMNSKILKKNINDTIF